VPLALDAYAAIICALDEVFDHVGDVAVQSLAGLPALATPQEHRAAEAVSA
jgi:hypothetical protein